MSYSPDANVLLAAAIPGHPHSASARAFIGGAAGSEFVLLPAVMSAFVRVMSNPKAVTEPWPPARAAAEMTRAVAEGGWLVAEPTASHWSVFVELLADSRASSTRVTDAWFAAQAIDLGLTWVTFDRDFRLFKGLRLIELA